MIGIELVPYKDLKRKNVFFGLLSIQTFELGVEVGPGKLNCKHKLILKAKWRIVNSNRDSFSRA